MLGSEGAHTGSSESAVAVYRYFLCMTTADHFLARAIGHAAGP
jgi:hypothetical protein